MSISSQIVLLLCVCCVQAQDFMAPSVNIFSEILKIKALEERLKTTEDMMQSQNNKLTSKLEDLKSENEGSISSRYSGFFTQSKDMKALKTTVQTLQEKVESLQNENEVRKVAFSASLLASGEGYTGPSNSPLIYNKVFTNAGNGYDSNTGIFTAPVKGVYYFRFYAHCQSIPLMAISLFKNGERQCSVYSRKNITNGNASNGIVLSLEKGDQMFTKLWGNSWVYDDSAGYTSFGGFLLFPL